MRRLMLIMLLVLMVAAFAALPASAQEMNHCVDTGEPGASEFGGHVTYHAQEAHLSGQMNPGHHQGYSGCIAH